ETRLALPRLLPAHEPLPRARRDSESGSVRRDAQAQRFVRAVVQPCAWARRASLPETLSLGARPERPSPVRAVPLHRPQPGPRKRVPGSARLALEQLLRRGRLRAGAAVPGDGRERWTVRTDARTRSGGVARVRRGRPRTGPMGGVTGHGPGPGPWTCPNQPSP